MAALGLFIEINTMDKSVYQTMKWIVEEADVWAIAPNGTKFKWIGRLDKDAAKFLVRMHNRELGYA